MGVPWPAGTAPGPLHRVLVQRPAEHPRRRREGARLPRPLRPPAHQPRGVPRPTTLPMPFSSVPLTRIADIPCSQIQDTWRGSPHSWRATPSIANCSHVKRPSSYSRKPACQPLHAFALCAGNLLSLRVYRLAFERRSVSGRHRRLHSAVVECCCMESMWPPPF